MDIVFHCQHCRQELEVDPGAAGEQIACPTCGSVITVPSPGPSASRGTIPPSPAPSSPPPSSGVERTFAVPLTKEPVQPLIQRPLPPLEAAAKDTARKLRVKTIRHSDCREVGHDYFDTAVTDALNKIGEENIVSINPLSYSYIEMGTQKLITDYGVMIVYRG